MKALNVRILLSVLIPALIVFGTLGMLGLKDHARQLETEIEVKSSTLMSLLRIISVRSYENFEYATLDEIAGGEALKDPEIAFVLFLDGAGNPLTEPPPQSLIERPDLVRLEEEIRSRGPDSRRLGYLKVGLDMTALKEKQSSETWTLLLSGVSAFVLLTISVVLLTRKLVADLQEANVRAEKALASTNSILEAIPVGVILVGRDKVIRRTNRTALDLIGREPHEVIGRLCHEQLCPALPDGCPVWDLGKTLDHSEKILRCADGRELPILKTAVPISLNGEEVLLEAFVDISANKRIEEQLVEAHKEAESASRAKSEFLATMSHEIRTPMNGVLGMAELLTDTELSSEQREFVETINQSARGLLTVINDILDFSKIEACKLELEAIPFDLESTAFDVAQILSPRVNDKGLEMILHYAPNCPRYLTGDAGRLRQILLNLAGNAVKFTETGHVILAVSCQGRSERGATLRIAVEDTGIGIPFEAQSRLFQSFTQADASTTRKYGGTGLGLAISKQLVELMGGEIGVESAPGRGSTFWLTVTLPLAAPPERVAPADLSGARVLVVDDNYVNRRIFSEQLSAFGVQADTIAEPEQTLERLVREAATGRPFQAVILDYLMPNIDGEQLGRDILAEPTLRPPPALMLLTSSGQRGDARRFREAGFAAYLTKPVLSDTLRQTLSRVLGSKTSEAGELPLVTRHTLAEARGAREQMGKGLSGRVLLVEDTLVNRKVALMMLTKLGVEAEVAMNGKEAVERFALDGTYDLILMDCQMPVMDGYAATRAIREVENDRRIPIVALTADATELAHQRCLDAGMDGYLAKPFTQAELGAVLEEWLSAQPDVPGSSLTPWTETATDAPVERSGPPVMDLKRIDRLRAAMGEDFEELVPAFLEEADKMVTGLRGAQAAEDRDTLRRLAHSLKSSSANLGAMQVSQLAMELELKAEEGELSDATAHIEAVTSAFIAVREELQQAAR